MSTSNHERYMRRCLQLALHGEGAVEPNPMVGAVLVHGERIIGEGFHQVYGGPHAEVNCFDSVQPADKPLIPESVLYVSLEPCSHFGKTPPCADRIITEGVQHVVIGCLDPFTSVSGKGAAKLRMAGIRVEAGILEGDCRELNKRFFAAHTRFLPFVTLKWAQSADGFIAGIQGRREAISNAESARQVHRLRATHSAILVGTNTALFDDPELTTRYWPGRSPLRVVADRQLRLPASLKLFNGEHPTLVLNEVQQAKHYNLEYIRADFSNERAFLLQLLRELRHRNQQSLLVEGGAQLLGSFFRTGLWNEAHRITAMRRKIGAGIVAPVMPQAELIKTVPYDGDRWDSFRPSPAEALVLRPE